MTLLLDPIWFQIAVLAVMVVLVVGLIIAAYQLYRLKRHYARLIRSGSNENLAKILEKLLDNQEELHKKVQTIQKDLAVVTKESQTHLQHIGFLRFNPFSDTGGEQSFVLSLLDQHKNGVIFTSLHNRDMTRVYAKLLHHGESKDIPLSDEEKEVVEKVPNHKG